jgi:hypothetical protein
MRLQRRFNRKVGDKTYDKYIVVVPPGAVEDLKWAPDQELDFKAKGRELILRPARKRALRAPA